MFPRRQLQFGERVIDTGRPGANGGVCYSSSLRTAASPEAEMIASLGHIRFDDGAINKARAGGIVTPVIATV
jgi:hypothetical protein